MRGRLPAEAWCGRGRSEGSPPLSLLDEGLLGASLPAGTRCCPQLRWSRRDAPAKRRLLERGRFGSLWVGLIPTLQRSSKAVLLLTQTLVVCDLILPVCYSPTKALLCLTQKTAETLL